MGFMDLFKPVESVSPDEVRAVIREKDPSEYCLLDVRQPGEYEQGHMPGARLMPLGELQARLTELERERTYYVYCRSGNRSRSATSLMLGAGFKNVLNIEGGIAAYEGLVASGGPEAGMFCFPEDLGPQELVAVAWLLEDGTQAFYRGLMAEGMDGAVEDLAASEDIHKETLEDLYGKLTGEWPGEGFPEGVVPIPGERMMEGCIKVESALEWARGREERDVLELMMALESNALDLYLKLARRAPDENARAAYAALCREEQAHIEQLAEELTERI
jgi:rhodanese-related sulfurtransferase/rubrerythrin